MSKKREKNETQREEGELTERNGGVSHKESAARHVGGDVRVRVLEGEELFLAFLDGLLRLQTIHRKVHSAPEQVSIAS